MNWIKPEWPLPAHIHAAVTLRTGGVSQGGYASLNPAGHVHDDPQHVQTNRRIIRDMLHLPAEPVWLQQVHGVQVLKADSSENSPVADASYTNQSGVVCAVLTADCLPVLFCGDQGRIIAAAHAGWRGLLAGVLEQTLKSMACREVTAWLGPAIGPEQFEVGEDVREAFVSQNPANAAAFIALENTKWLADIYHLARIELGKFGVAQIYGGGLCTVSDSRRFFSYRRDGAATGRMASLIWSVAV